MRLKLFPRFTLSLRVVSSPTGSLEDWDLAVQKTETRMNRINEQRAKVRAPHVARQRCICQLILAHVTVLLPSIRQPKKKPSLLSKRKSEPTSGGRPSQRRKLRRRFRREFEPGRRGKQIRVTIRTSGTKTPVSKDDETPSYKPERRCWLIVCPSVTYQASKRHRGDGDQPTEEQMETETGIFGRNAPPTAKKTQQGAVSAGQRRSDDNPELRNDDNSVFISNLSYTLEEPEAKLRTLFETCGPLKNIRPVFSNKGTFKGYCYVQFESAVSVPEALKLDRREVEGRPMFVSPCVDKNRNPDFKVIIITQ